MMVAITESDLVTQVRSGENAGKKIQNDHVVRRLIKGGTLEFIPRKSQSSRRDITILLDPKWKRENLKAVIYLQDISSMKVDAAASISLK